MLREAGELGFAGWEWNLQHVVVWIGAVRRRLAGADGNTTSGRTVGCSGLSQRLSDTIESSYHDRGEVAEVTCKLLDTVAQLKNFSAGSWRKL